MPQLQRLVLTGTACAAVLSLFRPAPASAQPVVPDGGSATTATTAASGQITVGIAPPNASRISHNTYSAFSVPAAGVNLDNRVWANTIVNEVTSSRRSFISGPVEVLGHRAHVIVANPNGITVDGGRFINTGGVVLSGGPVRYEPSGRPGKVDTVVAPGPGDITVTGAGLAGDMATLQLLAARLKIDGPVTNGGHFPENDVVLGAGDTEVVLDSVVAPNLTARDWLKTRRDRGGASDEVLVDVTPRGSLSASRIHIAVSARGAGVSYAGTGQAALGEFTIDAKGRVTTKGADIRAEQAVKIAADAIEILNAPERPSIIASNAGPVNLNARAGNLVLHGQVTGRSTADADPDTRAAVTLAASGDIKLLSETTDRLALAFAADGDLAVHAGGVVENHTGRLLANGRVLVTAARLDNVTDHADAGAARIEISRRRSKSFFGRLFRRHRKTVLVNMDYGEPRLPLQLAYVTGSAVVIEADDIVNTGEIDALAGPVLITAKRLRNEGFARGSYSYQKRCGVTCMSTGSSAVSVLGGVINANEGISITASDSIVNEGGQITAYGNLELVAPHVAARALFVPSFVNLPGGLRTFFGGPKAWALREPVGGQFIAPLGMVRIVAEGGLELDGGEIVAGADKEIPYGVTVRAPAQAMSPGGKPHIGLLRGLPN